MNEVQDNQNEPKTKGRKSDETLLAMDAANQTDDLSVSELERIDFLLARKQRKLEMEETAGNIEDRRKKDESRFSAFRSRGRELEKTKRDQSLQQKHCQHSKGGSGHNLAEGTDVYRSVIKHIMPDGNMWVRCQRCGATWKKPYPQDYATIVKPGEGGTARYSPLTPAQQEQYDAAFKEWKEACAFKTDNGTSSGITFRHSSEDGDVTARNFVAEVYRDVTLR
jgi:hypothetical protein